MRPVNAHRMMLHTATGGTRKPTSTTERNGDDDDGDERPREPGELGLRESEQRAQLREESGALLGRGTAGGHTDSLRPAAAVKRPLTPPQTGDRANSPQFRALGDHRVGTDARLRACLLPRPPSSIRRLRPAIPARTRPVPGWLHAGTPPTMWVELDQLPEDVWRCAPDGHLLVPVDVARTPDGLAGRRAALPDAAEHRSCGTGDARGYGRSRSAWCKWRPARSRLHGGQLVAGWASGRPVLAVHDGPAWGWTTVATCSSICRARGSAAR